MTNIKLIRTINGGPSTPAFDVTPVQRLQRASIALTAVMGRHSRKVREFQDNIAKLDQKVDELGRSMGHYRTQLASIPTDKLARKSRRLARMMDRHLK